MIPARKGTDALNRLASLRLGDADEAMRVYYDLKRLASARSGDVELRTAMAQACQIIGYRQEAVEHLRAAEALWSSGGLVAQARIANLLRAFGFSQAALKRAKILAELPHQEPELLQTNALTAIQFGDIDFLHQIAEQEIRFKSRPYAFEILSILNAPDLKILSTKLSGLQKVVGEIIAPYVMDTTFGTPMHPDDGSVFFSFTFHIDGSLIHRLDLDNQVEAALENYAANHLKDWPDWWWRYFVDISTAPRHLSIPAKPRIKVAA